VHGLKPHIKDELEMHNITTMEKARHKAKVAENKLKRSTQNYDKVYSKLPQTIDFENSKYPSLHLREENNYSLEAQQ
jgi:hypothetical protein